jgi:tripartite-type tricarboxylate transporter receptor subunit TctC
MLANTGVMVINPALYSKLPYNTLKDFVPVARTAMQPLALLVNPKVPANTLQEFVAYAKARPGQINYGSAGNGNITHLGAHLILQDKGLTAVHAPYKGSAPALTDLVAGQTQFTTDTINSALPFIKEKRLKALAVTSLKRTSVLPDVPTLNETIMPGFEVGAWQGVLVPAKTSPEIIKRLNTEVIKALGSADVRAKLAIQGAEPLGSTPTEYGNYIKSELERWDRVVKQTGASLD